MSVIGLNEFELEDELEDMYESEDEFEDESEAESEQFFGALMSLGKRALQSPVLRKAALSAAKSALGGIGGFLPQEEGEFEDELEDEFEDEEEDEFEEEDEDEDEFESEINPYRRIYPEAMMEHLGHAAMEAESEGEAEAFVRAMVPVAAHRVPHAAPALKKAAPHILKGVSNVAKTLLKSKKTKPLVRALPAIVKKTAMHIARQSHGGRIPVSPTKALKILAHHTAKTLGSPTRAVAAYKRSKSLDKYVHRTGAPIRLIGGRVHYAKPLAGGGHSRLRRVGWPNRHHLQRARLHGPHVLGNRGLRVPVGIGAVPHGIRGSGLTRHVGQTRKLRYGRPASYGPPRRSRNGSCCCCCGRRH